ncbi:MAG: Uma2 family endonuclease [Chloroflexota bacterium]
MIQQPTRLMSADELFKLPDDDHRYELVEGELRRMSPAGGEHGSLAAEFGADLIMHVREHRLGRVFAAETGYRLRSDPDTVRAPDVSFVRRGRLPGGKLLVGFLPLAPDLAVEVVSPSDTADDVQERIRDFLDAGTRLVVVVYPRTRTIAVHLPSGEVRTLGLADTFDAGDVVPGFRYAIADLFRVDEES